MRITRKPLRKLWVVFWGDDEVDAYRTKKEATARKNNIADWANPTIRSFVEERGATDAVWLRAISNRIRWAERQDGEFWKDFAHELKRVRAFIQNEYSKLLDMDE